MNHSSESHEPDFPAPRDSSATEPLAVPSWGAPPITAETRPAETDAAETDADDRPDGGYVPLPPAADDTFVPKARFTMGRSTKALVCVALVMAGALGGAAVQKSMDAGTRGTRSNFSNLQNPGAGTGGTPGQGRRGAGTQTGAPGNGTGAATATPQPSAGN